jgi:hypothetical protein
VHKRGRPRGLNINPVAVEDFLAKIPMAKAELCEAVSITSGHLADMLHRGKGASEETVRQMALALRCSPESIAPELLKRDRLRFVAERPVAADLPEAEAVA